MPSFAAASLPLSRQQCHCFRTSCTPSHSLNTNIFFTAPPPTCSTQRLQDTPGGRRYRQVYRSPPCPPSVPFLTSAPGAEPPVVLVQL